MIVRRSIAAAVAVVAAPVLSSCGFDAQTNQVYNPAVGTQDQSGSVDILNAVVVSGSDGSGTLIATLVNNDLTEDDKLTSVSGAGEEQNLQVTLGGTTKVDSGALLNLAEEGAITVEGEAVLPGAFLTLTFSFQRGASATFDVPVKEYSEEGPYADVPVP